MKPIRILLSAMFTVLLAGVVNATIRTVHNDPLYNAQFNTIGAAIAASSAGDTLLIHGSPVGYGSFTLNIPLAIIGHGHDPAVGAVPTFSYGQVNTGAAGSLIEGINFGYMYQYAPNVIIRGCKFTQFLNINSTATGNLITGCVFINSNLDIHGSAADLEVRNCYFSHSSTGNNFQGGSATTLVHHCVFVRTSTSTSTGNRLFQASSAFPVFADNVFHTATIASFNPQDCPNYSFQSNLSYSTEGALVSMGPNNLDNVAPTWSLASGSPLFDYGDDHTMLSGSPLTGASDGGQVGVMGGTTPLDKAGRPKNVPLVVSTDLLTPYVPVNGTIDVNFQAEQGQPQ